MRAFTLKIPFVFAAVVALCAPLHAATLFGLVDTGELFASGDGGVTWAARSALPASDAIAIGAGETSDELFLATRSGTVYRSTDTGVSWTAVGAVPAADVVAMLSRSDGSILLLTETGILRRSDDNGATFTSVATLTASNHVSLTADDGGGNLYALTRTGEVLKSADGGISWATVGVVTTPDAVEIRTVGLILYVLTGTGNVARSADQGVSWTTVGTISQVHMSGMTRAPGHLVATTSEGLVAASADGVSWSFVGSINQLSVVALGNDLPKATGIPGDRPPTFSAFELTALWPNPARGSAHPTTVSFYLPRPDGVALELYNIEGKLVAHRPREFFTVPGKHRIAWRAGELSSGIYFVRLTTGTGLTAHRKLAVVR
ncbi:MAG: T9SS type A sorting domain-containing protein [Candidatus Krumholzibacteriia bacterium]